MAVLTPQNTAMRELADEHRQWLSPFDSQYLANWEKMLKVDNEAAMTEAVFRQILQHHGVTVEPNESLAGVCGGQDFRCTKNGKHFYVEVTCITIAAAEKRSGMIAGGAAEPTPFNVMGMTEAVFRECQDKAPQCGDLDGPALMAVGTFHSMAAMVCFKKTLVNCVLTGKTMISWFIDPETGHQVGDPRQTTALHAAAFLQPDKTQEIGFARNSISGVLLHGVGIDSIQTFGVLHPNPARPFDPSLLPNVEFGSVVIDRTSQQLHVKWSGGDD